MLALTGPVITMPSACRGEATNWIPNRAEVEDDVAQRGQFRLASVAVPGCNRAKPERPPEEAPHFLRSSAVASFASSIRRRRESERDAAARRGPACSERAARTGAASADRTNRQAPEVQREPGRRRDLPAAPWHASAQARHPARHFARARSTGRPRNRSGSSVCRRKMVSVRMPLTAAEPSEDELFARSEVVARVGEIQALVAEREVRDLVAAQRRRHADPVVEGRIHDL